MSEIHFQLEENRGVRVLRLTSRGETNRLTRSLVLALTDSVCHLALEERPLVITGNDRFFSSGADLKEIAALTGPAGYAFSRMGQELMRVLDEFPAPVYAGISGYCMGGGLDL